MNDVNEDSFDCRFLTGSNSWLSATTLAHGTDITHEGPVPPATNEKT
jgi:hypothetical protein